MDRETYKKAIDSLSFSPDFQERTEAMLCRRSRESEKETLKMKLVKRPIVIAAIVALLMMSATGVYAVVLHLSASQVAEKMDQHTLAQAFEDNNAITVNETVESGDYAITLMGLTSGANLDEWNPDVDVTHTYAVVAVDRLDGTPLETSTFSLIDHPVTPLVSGYAPWAVNNWTLHCSVRGSAVDGTYYYLLDAGELGVFADHTVYLAFYDDGSVPTAEKFTIADDGSIAFAEDYQKAHALFVLPLDPSLADPAAAEALVAPYL